MNPPLTSYTVLWSSGPMDNPDDGTFTVDARDVAHAHELALVKTDGRQVIDGIIRTDIWRDL